LQPIGQRDEREYAASEEEQDRRRREQEQHGDGIEAVDAVLAPEHEGDQDDRGSCAEGEPANGSDESPHRPLERRELDCGERDPRHRGTLARR
jgi:hypothetical protein